MENDVDRPSRGSGPGGFRYWLSHPLQRGWDDGVQLPNILLRHGDEQGFTSVVLYEPATVWAGVGQVGPEGRKVLAWDGGGPLNGLLICGQGDVGVCADRLWLLGWGQECPVVGDDHLV